MSAAQPEDPAIANLREALAVSPNNLPLRRHLAESLARLGRFADAEHEYTQAVRLAPRNADLKLALARCYLEQGKLSEATVVAEDAAQDPAAAPRAHLLLAHLKLREHDTDAAARLYRRAVDADPDLADEALADRLGLQPSGAWQAPDDTDDEDDDPRVRIGRDGSPADEGSPLIELEKPKINFADVGGMDALKEEIRLKIIHPLNHPELYAAYGKKIGGGILMYGPPGCGKTHLARATAGEVNASFLSVGIHDVLDMWLGNSEKQLHAIFEHARRNRPCVLFFDEVDALGANRTDLRGSAGRTVINQFLSELDGVTYSNEGVLILAATNAPWHLDSAFRRPGRFDRVLFVPPPDEPARAAILKIMLEGKPTDAVDYDAVASKCPGFSGADLKSVIDLTIEAKLAEAMKAGIPQPITTKDLARAAKNVRPSTKEWFATARNYALYSNQGGVYDDILAYLKLK